MDRAGHQGAEERPSSQSLKSGPRSLKLRSHVRLAFVLLPLLLIGPPLRLTFITPPPPAVRLPALTPAQQAARYRIAVVTWGYHTGLVVEQPNGWNLGPPGAEDAPFLEYAWGDRRFYKDRDRSVGNTLALLLLGTPTVVYLAGWKRIPTAEDGATAVRERTVSAAELTALFTTLEQSFARTPPASGYPGRRPAPYPARDHTHGTFYPGREYYIGWYDCNAWTVARLHDAHLARHPLGTFVASQVPGAVINDQWSVIGGEDGAISVPRSPVPETRPTTDH